jgi:hypothetical protein
MIEDEADPGLDRLAQWRVRMDGEPRSVTTTGRPDVDHLSGRRHDQLATIGDGTIGESDHDRLPPPPHRAGRR